MIRFSRLAPFLVMFFLCGCSEKIQCGGYGIFAYLQGEDRQDSTMRAAYAYLGCRKVYEVARRDF